VTIRRLPIALLAAVTALSVGACGAGRDATTYQERNNAESSNASAGELALRNVAVQAPDRGDLYEVGEDATAILTVTNGGREPDTLVEVTSSAAREVVVLTDGEEGDVVVPGRGTTGSRVTLELRGLTRPLRTGEYIDLTFRFQSNGSVEVLTPVILTGKTDRPVYTGEYETGGHEPALQGPAGGDHGAGHGEDDSASTAH
jgi:copper(I)-binding protein